MRQGRRKEGSRGGREGQYVFLYHAMDYIRLEWAPEAVRQLECCIKWLYTLYLIVKVLFHIHV